MHKQPDLWRQGVRLMRNDCWVIMGGRGSGSIDCGERLRIETPGFCGYGKAD